MVTLSGTTNKTGLIIASGSDRRTSLWAKVNGKSYACVQGRSYGDGPISVTIPVNKGDTYYIEGVFWAYFIEIKV